MKHLLTHLFLIQAFFVLAQAPDLSEECNGEALVVTVKNPNDTAVYWYNMKTSTLIDSGNVVTLDVNYNFILAAVRHEDTTFMNLHKYFRGCHCQVYVPNTFTPDGDEYNERFRPIINCEVTAVNLFIYNRMGKEIYFSTNLNPEWDGTTEASGGKVADGIYVYLLYYVTKDGKTRKVNGFINVFT